jgi:hypothetical protein
MCLTLRLRVSRYSRKFWSVALTQDKRGVRIQSWKPTQCIVSVRSRPLILTGDFLILARGLFDARRPPSLHLSKYKAKTNFLHFQYVYYTIITTLNNIPFMMRCCRRTSCRTDVCHNTDFEQPVVQRCRSISTLYVFSICARYPLIPYGALRRSTRGPRVFLIINYFHSTPTLLGSVQTYNSFHAFTLLTDVLLFRPRPSIILFTFLRFLFCYDAILIRT